jgi:cyclic beta-1,2-glucan synthetase
MNRVGRAGRGESLFVAFFLYEILAGFIPLCAARGDRERVDRYTAYRTALAAALNGSDGWDGAWYRRAYYDDGAVLGSASNDECRIDALAQAWAVMSGAAPRERAVQALESVLQHLVDEDAGIIRLLTPAFDRTPHDPGYIKGYVPGVRENGGQYTHAALWAVRAFAEVGRLDDAARLLRMLSPARHGGSAGAADRYMTEPYVIAADVYGVPPHVGRGGWTWYTGSAGWMYRIALESVLGFGIEHGTVLRLTPQLPSDWPAFTLRYRHPATGATWLIDVKRGDGPTQVRLDGQPLALDDGVVRVPMGSDGAVHHLQVDVSTDHRPPAYAPR